MRPPGSRPVSMGSIGGQSTGSARLLGAPGDQTPGTAGCAGGAVFCPPPPALRGVLHPELREQDAAPFDEDQADDGDAEQDPDQEGDDDAPLVGVEGDHRRRRSTNVRFTNSNSSIRKSTAAPTKIISPALTPT